MLWIFLEKSLNIPGYNHCEMIFFFCSRVKNVLISFIPHRLKKPPLPVAMPLGACRAQDQGFRGSLSREEAEGLQPKCKHHSSLNLRSAGRRFLKVLRSTCCWRWDSLAQRPCAGVPRLSRTVQCGTCSRPQNPFLLLKGTFPSVPAHSVGAESPLGAGTLRGRGTTGG